MLNYIEMHYISPMSNYQFDSKDSIFTLALINTSLDNITNVYKTSIKDINNSTLKTKAFPIKKSFIIKPSLNSPSYCVKLFRYDKSTNMINLIFSGSLEIDKLEMGNFNYIGMDKAPLINGKPLNMEYTDDTTLLNEKFYNYEKTNTDEKCYVYLRKLNITKYSIMIPTRIELTSSYMWFYNRYANVINKEFLPKQITDRITKDTTIIKLQNDAVDYFNNKYCQRDDNYAQFLDEYQRDDRFMFDKNSSGILKNMISKRIKHSFRPLKYEPYTNTTIVSPADGKIRGFNINPTLKVSVYDKVYNTNSLVSKSFQLDGGSGFLCRVGPRDYQRVSVPYPAYLKEVGIYRYNSDHFTISLRFESTYFIPSSVHERDLLSAIYGNSMHGNVGVGAGTRYWPSVKKPQADTRLIYNLVIITKSDPFKFTNSKLINIKSVNKNTFVKPEWYEQGEEIGKLMCGNGTVLFLANRPIEFVSDIQYYSKMLNSTPLNNPIDTYVKTRDLIGILR